MPKCFKIFQLFLEWYENPSLFYLLLRRGGFGYSNSDFWIIVRGNGESTEGTFKSHQIWKKTKKILVLKFVFIPFITILSANFLFTKNLVDNVKVFFERPIVILFFCPRKKYKLHQWVFPIRTKKTKAKAFQESYYTGPFWASNFSRE